MQAKKDKKIGVAILGGTGYGAGELLRLLTAHPEVQVISVVSSSNPGLAIGAVHPHLQGFYGLQLEASLDFAKFAGFSRGVVFLALPHGTSAAAVVELLPNLEKQNITLIDLSGDFRLQDPKLRQKFYPEAQIPDSLLPRFVYGLPEKYREQISQAKLISNPGCLSSTCILAALPIIELLAEGQLVFDVKTGTSGAGKGLDAAFHYPTRFGNFNPYKIFEHRHEPEVMQELGDVEGKRFASAFVPHLLPTSRGVFASVYGRLQKPQTTEELLELYREAYQTHPFIRVRRSRPEVASVNGSNFCDVSIVARGEQIIAMAALDNLVKGAAGQAIQNMNLACGLPETFGLWTPALGPV